MSRSRTMYCCLVAGLIAATVPPLQAQIGVAPPRMTAPGGAGHDSAPAPRRLTRAQRENAQARVATATAILERVAAEAKALGRAPGWRQAMLETLLALPLASLQKVERDAFGLDALAAAIADAANDPPSLGADTHDLVYMPVTPCRYIDTRNVGGKITPAAARPIDIGNAGNVYGGQGTCTPNTMFGPAQDDIAAIAMNVGITEPSGAPGFLAIKPTLAAPVTSFMNWYEAGAHVQLANAGVVTLDQSPANAPEFFIQTSEATHVTVDIFGAFIAPFASALSTFWAQGASVGIANGAGGDALSAACPAGYTMTGGACHGGAIGLELAYSGIWFSTGNQWYCAARNTSGGATTLTAIAICGRTPGR